MPGFYSTIVVEHSGFTFSSSFIDYIWMYFSSYLYRYASTAISCWIWNKILKWRCGLSSMMIKKLCDATSFYSLSRIMNGNSRTYLLLSIQFSTDIFKMIKFSFELLSDDTELFIKLSEWRKTIDWCIIRCLHIDQVQYHLVLTIW